MNEAISLRDLVNNYLNRDYDAEAIASELQCSALQAEALILEATQRKPVYMSLVCDLEELYEYCIDNFGQVYWRRFKSLQLKRRPMDMLPCSLYCDFMIPEDAGDFIRVNAQVALAESFAGPIVASAVLHQNDLHAEHWRTGLAGLYLDEEALAGHFELKRAA